MRQPAAGPTADSAIIPQGMPVLLFKGALVGFTLGLGLALVASAWIWLEMRVNLGLLIPLAAFFGGALAAAKRKAPSYLLFAATQCLLGAALLARCGFDPGAFRIIPVCLFREGIGCTSWGLDSAGSLLAGFFIVANLLWISHEEWYKIKDRPR